MTSSQALDVALNVATAVSSAVIACLGFKLTIDPLTNSDLQRRRRFNIAFAGLTAVAVAATSVTGYRSIKSTSENANTEVDVTTSYSINGLRGVNPGSAPYFNVLVHPKGSKAYRLRLATAAGIGTDGVQDPTSTVPWDGFWNQARTRFEEITEVDKDTNESYYESPRLPPISVADYRMLLSSEAHIYVFAIVTWHNQSGSLSTAQLCVRLLHFREAIYTPDAEVWQDCPTRSVF